MALVHVTLVSVMSRREMVVFAIPSIAENAALRPKRTLSNKRLVKGKSLVEKPMWKKILNIIIYILVGGVIAFAFFGIVGLQAQVAVLERAVAEQDGDAAERYRRTARLTASYPRLQAEVKTLQTENEYLLEEVEALRVELEYQNILMRSHQGSNTVNIQKNADAIRDLAQRVNGNK